MSSNVTSCVDGADGATTPSPSLPRLRILLVGEGNLSFARALVKRLGASRRSARARANNAANGVTTHATGQPRATMTFAAHSPTRFVCDVLATTFDDAATTLRKYPEAQHTLAYLATTTRVRVRYRGGVDATRLRHTIRCAAADDDDDAAASVPRYDLIVFNNPHVGYEDVYRQRSLLAHFFASAADVSSSSSPWSPLPDGQEQQRQQEQQERTVLPTPWATQVVVALCDNQPQRWCALAMAARAGYVCVAEVPMLASEYALYDCKRHQSDAAFRYTCMVQYYFVAAAAVVSRCDNDDDDDSVLSQLRDVFARYAAVDEHVDGAAAQRYAAWMRVCDSFMTTRAQSSHRATRPRGTLTCDDDVLCHVATACLRDDAVWRALVLPSPSHGHASPCLRPCDVVVPLLHPRLAFYTYTDATTAATAVLRHDSAAYCPHVCLASLPHLYRAQLAARGAAAAAATTTRHVAGEARACDADAARYPTPPPPHLDERVLGRARTSKEEAKYVRWLQRRARCACPRGRGTARGARDTDVDDTGLRTCVRDVAAGDDVTATTVHTGTAYVCDRCTPSRAFATQKDVAQHMASKHGGVDVLHPNMYARVHTQLVQATSSSSSSPRHAQQQRNTEKSSVHNNDGDSDGAYCAVCDLHFVDTAAYDEHLACLAPSTLPPPLHDAERHAHLSLVCSACTPPRRFVDARALAQHVAQKHSSHTKTTLPP